jgi:SAM-dependent methyltransferase
MPQCRLCGSPTYLRFSARDYARSDDLTEHHLNWCPRCQFGRLDGEFTLNEVSRFYPSNYYTHPTTAKDQSSKSSFAERLLVHLAWRFDNGVAFNPSELHLGETVCDVGCGNGSNLRKFKELGLRTFGIDPDPIARAVARDSGEIFDGTAESLPLELRGKAFDTILMSHSLEHCIDPQTAIENAIRLLAPTGTLVVEVPNNEAIGFSWFKATWPWTDIPRHLNFFTIRSISNLVENCGLRITTVFYVGFVRQFLPSWWVTHREISQKLDVKPRQNLKLIAWLLLVRTIFAARHRKFDSIRIHARR